MRAPLSCAAGIASSNAQCVHSPAMRLDRPAQANSRRQTAVRFVLCLRHEVPRCVVDGDRLNPCNERNLCLVGFDRRPQWSDYGQLPTFDAVALISSLVQLLCDPEAVLAVRRQLADGAT